MRHMRQEARRRRSRPHPNRRHAWHALHSRRWHAWNSKGRRHTRQKRHCASFSHTFAPPFDRAILISLPVLRKIHPNLGRGNALPRHSHGFIHRHGVRKLHVAEECAATLALIQANLQDLSALLESRTDICFFDFRWESANPNCSAALGLRGLWYSPVLAHTVRCQRLVLCKVKPDRNTFDWCASQLCSLVNSLCVHKLHVAKLSVAELIDLQANHLHRASLLE